MFTLAKLGYLICLKWYFEEEETNNNKETTTTFPFRNVAVTYEETYDAVTYEETYASLVLCPTCYDALNYC